MLNNIRVVGDAPGPAFKLSILIDHSFYEGGRFGSIGEGGEIDGFDFNLAVFGKEGLKEDTVVLGDDIRIPVIDFVEEFQTEGIIGPVDETVGSGHLCHSPDRGEGVNNAGDGRKTPEVVVKHDRSTPKF